MRPEAPRAAARPEARAEQAAGPAGPEERPGEQLEEPAERASAQVRAEAPRAEARVPAEQP
ncbi:hypothetical protein, partial [Amycolatopsis circi]|uniref:hypothetical protein n=1 Tax=Amycolatopsis circi TaxID=871959 RepID=UPI001ABF24EC